MLQPKGDVLPVTTGALCVYRACRPIRLRACSEGFLKTAGLEKQAVVDSSDSCDGRLSSRPHLAMAGSQETGHAAHRNSDFSGSSIVCETAYAVQQHQRKRRKQPRLRWRQQQQQQQQQDSTVLPSGHGKAALDVNVDSSNQDKQPYTNSSSKSGSKSGGRKDFAENRQQPTCSSSLLVKATSSNRKQLSKSSAADGSKQLQALQAIKDKSFEELQEVVQQHGRGANLTNLMAMFSRLKSVKGRSSQEKTVLLQQLWQVLQGQLQHASSRHCTEALLTASKLHYSDKQLYSECLAAFIDRGSTADARTLANAIYAVATAANTIRSDPELRAAVARVLLPMFVRKANQASTQGVSNVVYSVALLSLGSNGFDVPGLLQSLPRGFWKTATVQELSNTLWGTAESRQVLSTQQLHHLLDLIVVKLPEAQPLHVTNTLWAVAVMGLRVSPIQLQRMVASMLQKSLYPRVIGSMLWSIGKLGAQLPQQQVDKLLEQLLLKLTAPAPLLMPSSGTDSDSDDECVGADTGGLQDSLQFSVGQAISNTLHGIATMKRTISQQQLDQLIDILIPQLADCSPQCLSNTLWATAVMKCEVKDQQLEALLSDLAQKLPGAEPQAVSNALWAASSLTPPYFARPLYSKEAMELIVRQHVPHMNPQELSNIAVACALLGHLDLALMVPLLDRYLQLLAKSAGQAPGPTSGFESQALCNIIWACVVLDMSDQAVQLQQLAAHCLLSWPSLVIQDKMQLYQLHMWLVEQCGQENGLSTGNSGCSKQHIDECQEAWVHVVGHMSTVSQLQQSVYEAVLQLPDLEDVQLEVTTPDQLWSMDIAAVTADGQKLAIEVNGPHHYRRPDGKANGSTSFRNKALTYRGYVVVEVSWMEWNAVENGVSDMSQQVYYLQEKVHKALSAAGYEQ